MDVGDRGLFYTKLPRTASQKTKQTWKKHGGAKRLPASNPIALVSPTSLIKLTLTRAYQELVGGGREGLGETHQERMVQGLMEREEGREGEGGRGRGMRGEVVVVCVGRGGGGEGNM
jgi:hypothetical protein